MGFEYDCRPASGFVDDALKARLLAAINVAGAVASDREANVFWVPTEDGGWPVTVGLHDSYVIVAFPVRVHARLPMVAALLAVLHDAGLTLHEQGDGERVSWSELLGAR